MVALLLLPATSSGATAWATITSGVQQSPYDGLEYIHLPRLHDVITNSFKEKSSF